MIINKTSRTTAELGLTAKVYADGKGPSYTYTPEGQIATRTWARGIVTTYSYDDHGQLASVAYSDGTPGVTNAYDRLGRVVTVTDALGTRTNVYDAATLALVEERLPGGMVLTRTQDSLGRPSGIALGGDYAVAYSYDQQGRFAAVTSSIGSAGSILSNAFTYAYLQGSDILEGWTSSHGTSHARTFEPSRNLITGIQNLHGTNLISSFAYTNDEIGRRTARIDTQPGSTTTNDFGYNIRSEIISAGMDTNLYSYLYDPIGNRQQAVVNAATNTYLASELNQYLALQSLGDGGTVRVQDIGNTESSGHR